MLFERCRDNGITQRLTGVRSPTTTGKVERFHQSIQQELIDDRGSFVDIGAAQRAVDEWVHEYNHERPHQSLGMATPAARFRPIPEAERAELPLKLPPNLRPAPPVATASGTGGGDQDLESLFVPAPSADERAVGEAIALDPNAVEIDRVVPGCGNLTVCGRQFWSGPRLAGKSITLWMDTKTVYLSFDARRLKTLPSRAAESDLVRLRRRAGPPPARPSSQMLARGVAIEVDRTVSSCGLVGLGRAKVSAGQVLAGQRVTLRLENDLIHVVAGGVLWRTIASPLQREQLVGLRGARVAGPPPATGGPIRIRRRVSVRGTIRVTSQRVQVGLPHARKVVTVKLHDTVLRIIDDDGEILKVVPRTTSKEVIQHKAHGRDPRG